METEVTAPNIELLLRGEDFDLERLQMEVYVLARMANLSLSGLQRVSAMLEREAEGHGNGEEPTAWERMLGAGRVDGIAIGHNAVNHLHNMILEAGDAAVKR